MEVYYFYWVYTTTGGLG